MEPRGGGSSEGGRVTALAAAPRRDLMVGLLLALLAVLVQADAEFEFRSDDVTLVAQGAETSALGCFLRSFMRPFADVGAVAFYRPLFSFDFGATGRLFGDDPLPQGLINLFLQGLAVLLGHRVLRKLGFGEFAALSGSLFFAFQPFAANNVAWLVGRSGTVATVTMLAVFLLERRARIAERGLPMAALAILLLGMLYRETAAFALVLVAIGSRLEGERVAVLMRRLVPLGLVVLAVMGLRLLVIGELVGGYAALDELKGGGASRGTSAAALVAFGRLLGFAPGTADAALDWRSQAALALSLGGIILAVAGRAGRGRAPRLLLLVALLHAIPLLLVDPEVQAGSSQRWHAVLWALTAVAGAGLARLDRRIALPLVLALAVLGGLRLRENLDDYERSSRAVRSLRAAIARSAEPVILAHGLVPYVGCAPFFELGAGQLVLPPFGDGTKVLYPLMAVAAHGPDQRRMQTPLVARFLARGERMSPIALDLDALAVFDMPEADCEAARRLYESRPRLDMSRPREGATEVQLDVDVTGAGRLEIHFVTPIAELRIVRRRGEGAFAADATRYREDLSILAEIGRHLDGAAHGRCYFWVTAHADRERIEEPFAVSVITAIDLEELPR